MECQEEKTDERVRKREDIGFSQRNDVFRLGIHDIKATKSARQKEKAPA